MAAQDDPTRPVWLLDVDGVLNAPRPGWGAEPQEGAARHDGHDFVMRWAPALMSQLRNLHGGGEVEIRWATTWVDEARQIETLMGLPQFGVAFSGLPDSPQVATPGLKLRAALTVLETEHRPLIWTDDDAIPAPGWARDRLGAAGPPVLLIAPDPVRGLQPAHLTAIRAFLDDPDSDHSDGPDDPDLVGTGG